MEEEGILGCFLREISRFERNRRIEQYPTGESCYRGKTAAVAESDNRGCHHRQLRISGMSSPCSAMYCLCSMRLSRMACLT